MSAWRTWFTISPLLSEWRPKTPNTRGFWRSCSPNPALSPTLCSALWAHCQTRQTICANCTLLQSTRARVPLSPCSSRAPPDTFLGTVRHGVQPSVTRQCLYPHLHSSTADICRQCRDLIIIISTSLVTLTPTHSVCTQRNMLLCKYFFVNIAYIYICVHLILQMCRYEINK